ncbi:unnamed protein product, partial [Ectocarpus sp. 4 AP-2014]
PTPSETVTAELVLSGINVCCSSQIYISSFLAGSIPPEPGSLRELNTLSLFRNQLTGHIPPQVGNLSALVQLNLRWNKLGGHIPPKLGNLSALEHLNLG